MAIFTDWFGITMTVSLRAPCVPSGLITAKVWPCRCIGCHIRDLLENVNAACWPWKTVNGLLSG